MSFSVVRGRSTLYKIDEFYFSDHGRQPQFGQNSVLARSKTKMSNWNFCIYVPNPFRWQKWKENWLFLVPKSSGPLLAGLPLITVLKTYFASLERLHIPFFHLLVCFIVLFPPGLQLICVGALISRRWIRTAASCFYHFSFNQIFGKYRFTSNTGE